MKVPIISAAIASVKLLFSNKDTNRRKIIIPIIECLLLVGFLWICIFTYEKWTEQKEDFFVVKFENLNRKEPIKISILKNYLWPDSIGHHIDDYQKRNIFEGYKLNDLFTISGDTIPQIISLDKIDVEEWERSILNSNSIDSVNTIYRLSIYNSSKFGLADQTYSKVENDGMAIYGVKKDSLINYVSQTDFDYNTRFKINDIGNQIHILTAYNNRKLSFLFNPIDLDISRPLSGEWFESGDISNMIIHFIPMFGYRTELSNLQLSFGQPIEVQNLIPQPDYLDAFRISYNDSLKLELIKEKGLTLKIDTVNNKQLQETRMSVLTMIITLVFSLLVGLLYRIFKQIIRNTKHVKLKFLYIVTLFIPGVTQFLGMKFSRHFYHTYSLFFISTVITTCVLGCLYWKVTHKNNRSIRYNIKLAKLQLKIMLVPMVIIALMVLITMIITGIIIGSKY